MIQGGLKKAALNIFIALHIAEDKELHITAKTVIFAQDN